MSATVKDVMSTHVMAVGKIEGTPETASVGHDIIDGRPREPARPARGTSAPGIQAGQDFTLSW